MARTTVTEESLGLAPTEDELNTAVTVDRDDDIPIGEDNEPALAPAKPGPEKQAKAEPEAQEGDKQPEPDKPDEQPKQVDVRALQEARAEAREAKRQAAILEQRWNDFIAYQQQPKAQEQQAEQPVIPDVDDPTAVLAWAREQIISQQEAARTEAAQRQQRTAQLQAFQQAFDHINADYATSLKDDPSIGEAHHALRQSIGAELLALGRSPAEAAREIASIENQHLVHVAQTGQKIGDYIKALAGARGWNPAAQQTASPKTDLAAVAAAQQRHQSLSDAGGGEAVAPLDAKALGRMTDKEFKAWMSKKGNEAKFDEIMGG